ncbi:hypothetical protein C8E97_2983 [Saccharothrix australiensis]|uniref:Uncharacterized protein n=1 Tax=Saccharothrix australiensis TaxID=2072 RepID=A0A495W0U0_9PSEU|nr:hypothetical protein C8E97_2983 [Saccharothrix australiensis]
MATSTARLVAGDQQMSASTRSSPPGPVRAAAISPAVNVISPTSPGAGTRAIAGSENVRPSTATENRIRRTLSSSGVTNACRQWRSRRPRSGARGGLRTAVRGGQPTGVGSRRRSAVPVGRAVGAVPRKPRSRRLLVTTNTDENAIAAPAIIGFSRPAAASGSAATL